MCVCVCVCQLGFQCKDAIRSCTNTIHETPKNNNNCYPNVREGHTDEHCRMKMFDYNYDGDDDDDAKKGSDSTNQSSYRKTLQTRRKNEKSFLNCFSILYTCFVLHRKLLVHSYL